MGTLAYRMCPVEMETKQQLMVVCILALATYAVSRSSLSDLQSQEMYRTPVTAACQQLILRTVSVKWASIIMASSVIHQLSECFSYPSVSVIRIPSGPSMFR